MERELRKKLDRGLEEVGKKNCDDWKKIEKRIRRGLERELEQN